MIVGFDGTDTGLDGLVLSIGLARALGSEVTVVYVYDEELRASSREAARELAEHADAVLASARDRVSQALAIRFRALSASSPAQGLHELARGEEADLIVLGSRRLGPRTKAAFGAVSENVMRAAPCAVAVAPRGYRSEGGFVPQRIAVGWIPTNEGEDALGVAYRIARATGGSVELVTTTSTIGTVKSLETRARRAIEGVVDALRGEVEVAIRAGVGKAAEELVNRSGNMDLIVLGSRGYGPPRTMLFGSVSSRVVPEALCPVMIMPTRGGD
ncbi:MAG TPA: universal stress protein [Solirubrobacteraceae bacterium]|nr:universal stress protein [Solirubrobacteraceae bacterium]